MRGGGRGAGRGRRAGGLSSGLRSLGDVGHRELSRASGEGSHVSPQRLRDRDSCIHMDRIFSTWQISQTLELGPGHLEKDRDGNDDFWSPLQGTPARKAFRQTALSGSRPGSAACDRVAWPCLLLGLRKLRGCVSSILEGGLVL